MSTLAARVLILTHLLFAGSAWGQAQLDARPVWIDVRSPAEYASGHLEGAHLIPFDGIEAGVARLKLGKETPIYLYCATGGRSEVAKQRLEAQHFTQVINVGGLLEARQLAGKTQ